MAGVDRGKEVRWKERWSVAFESLYFLPDEKAGVQIYGRLSSTSRSHHNVNVEHTVDIDVYRMRKANDARGIIWISLDLGKSPYTQNRIATQCIRDEDGGQSRWTAGASSSFFGPPYKVPMSLRGPATTQDTTESGLDMGAGHSFVNILFIFLICRRKTKLPRIIT